MLFLLLACSPDSLTLADPTDLSGFLTAEAQNDIPERARIRSLGSVSVGWGAGAVPLPSPSSGEDDLDVTVLVADQSDTAVAAVVSTPEWRLLLTVQRDDLWSVLSETAYTALLPDEGVGSGLRVPAGTRVDEEVRYDEAPLVISADWSFGLRTFSDSWAPPELVDVVYQEPTSEERYHFEYDAVITTRAALRDAPEGEVISPGWYGRPRQARLLEEDGGWSLVEVADEKLRVRGYVPTSSVEAVDAGSMWTQPFVCGMLGSAWLSYPDVRNIPRDTWLYADLDGHPIGKTRRSIEAEVLDTDYGWELIALQTAWGPVEVWLDPGQEYPDEDWEILDF